jgi:SlyX protein
MSGLTTDEQTLARIDELETRIAFQEDLINSLNDALGQQQRRLMELTRSIEKLHEQIKETREQPLPAADDEPPPHY